MYVWLHYTQIMKKKTVSSGLAGNHTDYLSENHFLSATNYEEC